MLLVNVNLPRRVIASDLYHPLGSDRFEVSSDFKVMKDTSIISAGHGGQFTPRLKVLQIMVAD